jgi:hypothetical protein
MNKQFIYLTSILVLAIAAIVAVPAQETDAAANATLNNTTLNNTIQAAQNLSTVNGQPPAVAAISKLASAAPLVAAGASSAQVASQPDSYKIGTGVGESHIFNPEHIEIEPLNLGIPIKPMRDTGKMFFVCNIV